MPKIKDGELVCVKIYLPEKEFAEVVKEAEEAGERPLGLKLKVVKAHGGPDEYVWNTKHVGRFLKRCYIEWMRSKAERAVRAAQAGRELQAAKEKAIAAGLKI